jgi:hypothetical protein
LLIGGKDWTGWRRSSDDKISAAAVVVVATAFETAALPALTTSMSA